MKKELFDELLQSVKEAAAIERSKAKPSRIVKVESANAVVRVRSKLGLSQNKFARLLGISENTVEQHLTKVVRQVGQLFGHRCRTSALLSQARKIKERLRGRS